MNLLEGITESVSNFLKKPQSTKSDINILLLGETGVGKSTFINSFANYITYNSLAKVQKNKLHCLIPTRFSIADKDFEDQVVELGCDNNEDQELGNSSTQGARAYTFNHKQGFKIRLIDTPGIGDYRGLEQDRANFENVLSYIGQFEYLHAICIFLKPNESVLNAYFKFCLIHLFSRLEKSASNNICFIFTNARSTFFKPGDTLPVLRKVLAEIKNNPPFVEIPCSKKNMFCLDNEGFKFLVASKQGIEFGFREKETFSNSFYVSVDTCRNLIKYICGDSANTALVPHTIQKTLSVNEARRVIIDLSKPLADITDLIDDNLTVLERHQKTILNENITIAQLQKKLFLPGVDIKQKTLTQPVTVCTASKCSETYTFSGITKYHYKQRCHNPCYLDNVPEGIMGSPQLQECWAMNGTQTCRECGCHFTTHMHLLYETELVDVKLEDDTVKVVIKSKEDMVQQQFNLIQKLQARKSEYENEKKIITQALASFAHFLEKSTIILYNDSYIDYINYLIQREEGLGAQRDLKIIHRYEELRKQYVEEKQVLNMALKKSTETNIKAVLLNPQDIFAKVKSLYSLKHTGKKIQELHQKQEQLRKNAHTHFMEYYCPSLQVEYEEEIVFNGNKAELVKKLLTEKNLEDIEFKIALLDLSSHFGDQEEVDVFKKDLLVTVQALYTNTDQNNEKNVKDLVLNDID